MVGLLLRLRRIALPLLCVVLTLVLLGGGGILLGNYLYATSGTPVTAQATSCQMHVNYTSSGASGSRHLSRQTAWICQASYELDGQPRTGTLPKASHDLTGERVIAYAKGSQLLQTATWHRNVGIAMLVAGVLFVGAVSYHFVVRRRKGTTPIVPTAESPAAVADNPWA
jgi:hypothetical protein